MSKPGNTQARTYTQHTERQREGETGEGGRSRLVDRTEAAR